MKKSRSLMIAVLAVVLAPCTGILLGGCASTGDTNGAGQEMQAPPPSEKPTATLQATSDGNPETRPGARREPGPAKAVPAAKPRAEEAGAKASVSAAEGGAEQPVAYVAQRLQGLLPEWLRDVSWERLTGPIGGTITIALIWGLAFWLGRLPRRRRGAGRARVAREVRERVGVPVAHST
ncbi:MAG: hypothetical protein JXR77_09365 [Lentisphaeria bacterium]|nr:hypothetical protein [Lentisphaeria bacterium]